MGSTYYVRLALDKIISKLDVIDAKVSTMPQVEVQVTDRLVVTLNALRRLNRSASASEVAAITGKARAHESMNLNDLVGRGILTKHREGRKQLFSLREDLSLEELR